MPSSADDCVSESPRWPEEDGESRQGEESLSSCCRGPLLELVFWGRRSLSRQGIERSPAEQLSERVLPAASSPGGELVGVVSDFRGVSSVLHSGRASASFSKLAILFGVWQGRVSKTGSWWYELACTIEHETSLVCLSNTS